MQLPSFAKQRDTETDWDIVGESPTFPRNPIPSFRQLHYFRRSYYSLISSSGLSFVFRFVTAVSRGPRRFTEGPARWPPRSKGFAKRCSFFPAFSALVLLHPMISASTFLRHATSQYRTLVLFFSPLFFRLRSYVPRPCPL